jgi:hypothetical protein
MLSPVDDLVARITQLERELETEVNRARDGWRYRIEAGRIRFERDVRLAHARVKQRIPRFLRESSPLNILTAPLIYSMVVPIAIVDLAFSIYQGLCFPIYGIARVRRGAFFRHRSSPSRVSERHRKAELRLLRIRQRCPGIRSRDRRAHRAVLVPDPACHACACSACALSGVRRLRRCRWVSQAAADAARQTEGSVRCVLWQS